MPTHGLDDVNSVYDTDTSVPQLPRPEAQYIGLLPI